MKIIYLIFFITINIIGYEFVELGENIVVNICSQYPKSEVYNWLLISKPENSNLDVENILNNNKENCLINITPDKVGLYIISVTIENKNISFQYEVLESMEKNQVNIKYLNDNKYYFNKLDYYKFYDKNHLIFNLGNKILNFNFEIKGIALIEDLSEAKTFLINTDHPLFIKDNYNYKINFYPDNYDNLEMIFNSKTFNKNMINFIPIENKLDLEITAVTNLPTNKKIIGITTLYYNNLEISKFTNKNSSTKNLKSILFSPLKSINNYPSILYTGEFTQKVQITYDKIDFYNLKLELNERQISLNKYITIKIKSVSLDKCLVNQDNLTCFYQRTINTNKTKEISIPKGIYKLEIYKKGYYKEVKDIIVDENLNILIENTNKKEIAQITLDEDIRSISFSDIENQNFFFEQMQDNNKINIPYGIYNVTIYSANGLYNIYSLEVNNNLSIQYISKNINISIKENGEIIYGGIIIINGQNYIYNNGKIHYFTIKQ